jgi:hypothetical protein
VRIVLTTRPTGQKGTRIRLEALFAILLFKASDATLRSVTRLAFIGSLEIAKRALLDYPLDLAFNDIVI